jgi:hypothetical protein
MVHGGANNHGRGIFCALFMPCLSYMKVFVGFHRPYIIYIKNYLESQRILTGDLGGIPLS